MRSNKTGQNNALPSCKHPIWKRIWHSSTHLPNINMLFSSGTNYCPYHSFILYRVLADLALSGRLASVFVIVVNLYHRDPHVFDKDGHAIFPYFWRIRILVFI